MTPPGKTSEAWMILVCQSDQTGCQLLPHGLKVPGTPAAKSYWLTPARQVVKIIFAALEHKRFHDVLYRTGLITMRW